MNRRRLLKTGAVLSTASVAGCVGDILPGGEQSVFESVSRQGNNLVVNLRSDANIQRVNLISPNGNMGSYAKLSSGESKATLTLFEWNFARVKYAYAPGTNTLAAIDSNGDIHEKKIPLKPRLKAENISFLGRKRSSSYAEYERYTEPVIQIRNTGSAPAVILESAVTGSQVPAPKQLPSGQIELGRQDIAAELAQLGRDESADTDLKNRGPQRIVTLPPSSSLKVITAYHPFGFPTTAVKMSNELNQQLKNKWGGKSASATATLVERTGRLKTEFTVQFGGNVKGALTSGEEYQYFQNARVVGSSINNTS